jgi:predicted ATPase/Tfp pilus assembly protein PilF
MDAIRLHLLGGFALWIGERRVREPGQWLQSLLALMTLRSPRALNRAEAASILWPDASDSQARAYLRRAIAAVREALPEPDAPAMLEGEDLGWRPGAPISSDVAAFERAIALRDWPGAIVGYTGALLPAAADEWLVAERERLSRMYCDALANLAQALERAQDYAGALAQARRLVALDSLDELAWVRVMRLSALLGNRAGLARAYRDCARALREELGVAPAPATERAYRRFNLVDASRLNRLPPQASPMIGRVAELRQLDALLADPERRLITLIGLGGAGKTRLAVAAAARQAGAFLHGVVFVDLTEMPDARSAAYGISEALGLALPATQDPFGQLREMLRDRSALLVLDNAETLLDLTRGDLSLRLSGLLAESPELKLLVTSREPLGSRWETVLRVEGLSEDDAQALFERAARGAGAPAGLEPNSEALRRIIALTEGAPLALELAAAAAGEQPLVAVAAALEAGIDGLQAVVRDALPRQRSMTAAFDHSWRLLSADEQRALRATSVFHGGFGESAAIAVTGLPRAAFRRLARISLLRLDVERGRYGQHALVRRYAAQRLAENPADAAALLDAHMRVYADFTRENHRLLDTPEDERGLAHLTADLDNLRAGWDRAIAIRDRAALSRYVDALRLFRIRFRDAEGLAWTEAALEAEGWTPMSPALAETMSLIRTWRADYLLNLGRHAEVPLENDLAETWARRSGSRKASGRVLRAQADAAYNQGRTAEARALAETAIADLRAVDDIRPLCGALNVLGNSLVTLGDLDGAQAAYEETLRLCPGMWQIEAPALINLGVLAQQRGRPAGARAYFERVLETNQRRGEPSWPGLYDNIGEVLLQLNDEAGAVAMFRTAIEESLERQQAMIALNSLLSLGRLIAARGEPAAGLGLALFVAGHPGCHVETLRLASADVARLSGSLRPDDLAAARAWVAAQTLESAAQWALGHFPLRAKPVNLKG